VWNGGLERAEGPGHALFPPSLGQFPLTPFSQLVYIPSPRFAFRVARDESSLLGHASLGQSGGKDLFHVIRAPGGHPTQVAAPPSIDFFQVSLASGFSANRRVLHPAGGAHRDLTSCFFRPVRQITRRERKRPQRRLTEGSRKGLSAFVAETLLFYPFRFFLGRHWQYREEGFFHRKSSPTRVTPLFLFPGMARAGRLGRASPGGRPLQAVLPWDSRSGYSLVGGRSCMG